MADNKKPSGLKFSPWWITGAIIFMFVLFAEICRAAAAICICIPGSENLIENIIF